MKFTLLPLAVAITVALHPMAAFADEETANNSQNKDQTIEKITISGRYTVNENIDTATGLGLTLRETPQSVSILTAERIQDQALTTVVDVANNAVGISSSQLDNVRNTMSARGFNINNYQIDGVPLSWSLAGDAGETTADVAIYERVEFVRGATGLLTGAGDPSASINLVRKHADSTELTGYVDVEGGSWDKKQITADVANGLNDAGTIRGRMVAKYSDSDSYIDEYQEKSTVLYGVLEGDLSNATTVRVGGHYQHSDPTGSTWGALPAFYSDGTKTDWDSSATTGTDWTKWETESSNYFATVDHMFSNGWQLLANYNYIKNEKDSKLILVAGAPDPVDYSGMFAQRYRGFGETEQNSFDVQLKGDFELFEQAHSFVVGALTSQQDGVSFTQDPVPLAGSGWDQYPVDDFTNLNAIAEPMWGEPNQVDDNQTEQKGIYAATRLSVTDDLKFIVGGRVSSWERERVYYGAASNYGDDGVFVPYVGALYDITDQHRIYTSYTEIFNPQNSQDANGDYLDPIKGKSVELGLKSTFLDDRLHTSVAVFQINQDNLAVLDTGSPLLPDGSQPYRAADGTESKGFEIEIVGQPAEGWDISGGYSQFEAEDRDGAKVNTEEPRKQFKLFTTYNFVDILPELTIGGGVNWQSEIYSNGGAAYNNVEVGQGSYALVNLMARYHFTDQMNLQVNINNLLDEKYYNYVTAGYYNQYRYGAPSNVTASFNYKF